MTLWLFALKKNTSPTVNLPVDERNVERERDKSHTSLDNMLLFLEKKIYIEIFKADHNSSTYFVMN